MACARVMGWSSLRNLVQDALDLKNEIFTYSDSDSLVQNCLEHSLSFDLVCAMYVCISQHTYQSFYV